MLYDCWCDVRIVVAELFWQSAEYVELEWEFRRGLCRAELHSGGLLVG
jgi:hypothetical protein